jgi:hypothetical protein
MLIGLSIVIMAIGAFGGPNSRFSGFWRIADHGRENWRDALATVRQIAGNTSMPVVVRSGLVESAYLDWRSESASLGYLFAPLLIYPPAGRVIRMPYIFHSTAREYFEEVVTKLNSESRVLLVTSEPEGWLDHWIGGRLAGVGFGPPRLWTYNKGYVRVLLFERVSHH